MPSPLAQRFLRGILLTALFVSAAPQALPGQGYRRTKIPAVGISITVNKRLKSLPLRLDSNDPHLRARFRTEDRRDFVKVKGGRAEWFTDVYEFGNAKNGAAQTPGRTKPEAPKTERQREIEKLLAKLRARSSGGRAAKSFKQWAERQNPTRFVTEGKQVNAKGGKLPYKLWEFVTSGRYSRSWYTGAAVYTLEGREVALIVRMPIDKGDRPKGEGRRMSMAILGSGKLLKEGDDELATSSRRDKYADTPKKKKALDAAKKNIQGMANWSYFTTPNYVVLFSWEQGTRGKSENVARRLSSSLEKMRKLYMEYYKPEQGMEMPYSVFRVCATYKQFQKYGSSPPGVVGWFSPRSKELVVFQGGDSRMRKKGYIETVTHHEGWHQYSDAFFGGVELHRWFDEGHGDWFGAHKPVGSQFTYIGSDMRYKWVKLMVKKGDYVPFKDIVKWPRSRFYGNPRTAYFYAQAYGMIDFLRKGHALGDSKFDPAWSKILPTYRRVVLEKKNASLATAEAFKGVDFPRMEAAWKDWVDSSRFKKPR